MEEITIKKSPFTKLPKKICENLKIGLAEAAVYLVIRDHLNHKTKLCCPAIATIAKECQSGKDKIIGCIKTLVEEGYIKKWIPDGKRSNHYGFPEERDTEEGIEMIAQKMLKNPTLTKRQCAYLAIIQQYLRINKEDRTGDTWVSTLKLTELTKLSPSTIRRLDQSLIDNGMMTKFKSNIRDEITGLYNDTRRIDLDKTEQATILLADDLQNTKDIIVQSLTMLASSIDKLDRRMSIMEENSLKLISE